MKKIKFRGADIKNDSWHYGDLLQTNEGSVCIGVHGQYIDDGMHFNEMYDKTPYIEEHTIGQYTGLCDKNENEIYEGDVLEDSDLRYEVCWYDEVAAFIAEDIESNKPFLLSDLDLRETVIIGNIYDNPELLKTKE